MGHATAALLAVDGQLPGLAYAAIAGVTHRAWVAVITRTALDGVYAGIFRVTIVNRTGVVIVTVPKDGNKSFGNIFFAG